MKFLKFLPLLICFFIGSSAYAVDGWWGNGGGTGGGSFDPALPLITQANDPTLTGERRLVGSAPILLTDGGADSTMTISLDTVPITSGGTNATSASAAVINLLGTPTKGTILIGNGSVWNVLGIGADATVLTADSSQATGARWASSGASISGEPYIVQALSANLSAERVLAGTTNKITITDGGANGNMTLNVGSDIVQLTSTQTLTNKTLTSPSIGTNLIFELGTFDTTIQATAPAAARLYTIPDAGGAASFVMTEGAQTINGVKTYGGAQRFNGGIQNSSGNTITLPSTAQTLATIAGTETLTSKTLTSPAIGTQVTLNQASFNYTLNWANPAAARTYSIRDIGGAGNIAMDTGTPTGIAYGDGNKIAYLGAPSTGQIPKYNGSAWAYAADSTGGGFGGNGADGAVTKGAVTETTPLQISATTFTQTVSTTWVPFSGTVVNASSTYTADGTTNVAAGFPGGAANRNGLGPAPGLFVSAAGGSGGGGRGGGGGGGNGGIAGAASPFSSYTASSGSGSATAAGGAGGGKLTVCAVGAITISSGGSINAAGAAGVTDTAGSAEGGGGGAGGIIILASQASITQTGTATVAGGAGGNGGASGTAYGGGGGGGGYYVRVSPSNTGAGVITVTGGAAGTANSAPGSPGSNGTAIAITATPNVPLIGMLQDRNNLRMLAALKRISNPTETHVSFSDTQVTRALAAIHSDAANFQRTCQILQFGEDFQGSKVVQIDRADRSEALRNAG